MVADKTIIEVDNLTFRYDLRKKKQILSAISFSVKQGEWIAVVGDNGSGKSTLARLLVGLLEPENGTITIDGIQLNEETKWDIRKKIGLVFQNPENQFIGTTVQDDVAFGLENNNTPYNEMKQIVEEALQLVEMDMYWDQDPSRLSGGQKQRVAIAGILAFKPNVIILDEAFVMLDPKSRNQLLSTLKQLREKRNITIISVTHDMNEAAIADRILVMDDGTIIQDSTPEAVFKTNQQLAAPFPEQLRRKLAESGSNVPQTYMTEDEMVRWLCK
ncbi:Energy-coupling factor transporter ATP-binding protein EcfA1 [Paraliobacillus sp. PM-2]|uniref:energy-coupling factor transporter ATPase n=1 Tax=Paraliobacillus sp. PM-2 TaxID=1462524 RepID=UPI00061CDA3E|nr:energy-coupling factor transporter ATPase [Paraliobacillus sp. PM-2]CQR47461.1 Energy-coupling factor transporter ATP-binding protein EcfA1 [Paraliobacillus sp. PM-2]